MKKILSLSTMVLALVILSGCTNYKASIYNVPNSPIKAGLSENEISKAIKLAGASLGWKITDVKEGELSGKLQLRSHIAMVKITYTNTTYNITYTSSLNLKYDKVNQTIHSNYNGWIQNLQKAIDRTLDASK
jgi:hypothetical protein